MTNYEFLHILFLASFVLVIVSPMLTDLTTCNGPGGRRFQRGGSCRGGVGQQHYDSRRVVHGQFPGGETGREFSTRFHHVTRI